MSFLLENKVLIIREMITLRSLGSLASLSLGGHDARRQVIFRDDNIGCIGSKWISRISF